MPRLVWGLLNEKTYELGVDRGVFYPPDGPGVAWPGLRVIDTINANQNLADKYFEGQKFATDFDRADIQLRIGAYAAPAGFAAYDGLAKLAPGVYATHQPRERFGFSFRTLVGNAARGQDYGYKIHIVHNAVAFSTETVYATLTSSAEPTLKEWQVLTIPYHKHEFTWFDPQDDYTYRRKRGIFAPGAYFVVSSRSVSPEKLAYVEDVLYGTSQTEPELPAPSELIEMLR
jgi:hypothetical protein